MTNLVIIECLMRHNTVSLELANAVDTRFPIGSTVTLPRSLRLSTPHSTGRVSGFSSSFPFKVAVDLTPHRAASTTEHIPLGELLEANPDLVSTPTVIDYQQAEPGNHDLGGEG